jgi:hypothetical protein
VFAYYSSTSIKIKRFIYVMCILFAGDPASTLDTPFIQEREICQAFKDKGYLCYSLFFVSFFD